MSVSEILYCICIYIYIHLYFMVTMCFFWLNLFSKEITSTSSVTLYISIYMSCCWFVWYPTIYIYKHFLHIYELLYEQWARCDLYFELWTEKSWFANLYTRSHRKIQKCNCQIPSHPNRRATIAASVTWEYFSSVIQLFSVLIDIYIDIITCRQHIETFIYICTGQALANSFIAFCSQDQNLANRMQSACKFRTLRAQQSQDCFSCSPRLGWVPGTRLRPFSLSHVVQEFPIFHR